MHVNTIHGFMCVYLNMKNVRKFHIYSTDEVSMITDIMSLSRIIHRALCCQALY